MMQEVITVCDGSLTIGNKKILKHITCKIGTGEFVGIIGPNGAGKSTLLRCMRGFLPLTEGEIKIHGRSITKISNKELAYQIAYMQQEVNIGFGYTGLEVVLAGRYPYLKWWQNEQEEDLAIAFKYMEFTGVDSLANKPVQNMSGGEKQRVLLAKVLAQETPILFLDEPTASLDVIYQEEIFRYCQLIVNQGKTVLVVAHDLKLAAKYCSRLFLVADGSIISDGVPENVITEENLQVAYGLHAAVFRNKVTGSLDFHTYTSVNKHSRGTAVHVICGGGSGSKIIRRLYENGYHLTMGVLHPSDTDAVIAEAFHISCVVSQPFSKIDTLSAQKNRAQIAQADWVVLSNVAWGEQNIDNLHAAFCAKKLIIIEDTPIEERDFLQGQGIATYYELLKIPQVAVMTSLDFIETFCS